MRALTRVGKTWLAVSVGALVLTWASVSSASLVTFEFFGPVTGAGTFVKGHITYETATAATDVTGPGDQGDRLFYEGAITSFSFKTEQVSRSFSAGDIQLWNDFINCLSFNNTTMQCTSSQAEPDRLFFDIELDLGDTFETVSLIISGVDQTMLSSGALPGSIPRQGVFRTDFFWDFAMFEPEEVELSLASNEIQIPEPATLGLLLVGFMALGVCLKLGGFPAKA